MSFCCCDSIYNILLQFKLLLANSSNPLLTNVLTKPQHSSSQLTLVWKIEITWYVHTRPSVKTARQPSQLYIHLRDLYTLLQTKLSKTKKQKQSSLRVHKGALTFKPIIFIVYVFALAFLKDSALEKLLENFNLYILYCPS